MPTPQSLLLTPALERIRQVAPLPVALQDLYGVVEARVELDAGDHVPPMQRGKPVGEPSWRRNLRNALKQEKREGRLANPAVGMWTLARPDPARTLDPDAAWAAVTVAARRQGEEVFVSPTQERRYRVGEVTPTRIEIERVDANAAASLTPSVVRQAIVALNASGGRSGLRTLHYTVAKETALVHLHPDLVWEGDAILARSREGTSRPTTATEALGQLTRNQFLEALLAIGQGARTSFADSTGYDLLHEGRRYAPLQVAAVAVEPLLARRPLPHSAGAEPAVVIKGGLGSPCFLALARCGFDVVPKESTDTSHPDELQPVGSRPEGGQTRVWVNRYERDDQLRDACLAHHGAVCQACEVDMEETYGTLGNGFVHVHHVHPLAKGEERETDPVRDLVPVCPNCHAMLHRGRPAAEPRTIEELRRAMGAA